MAESPLPAGTLADRTGMSRFAAARHLRKLTRRGYVRKGRGVYRYGRPRDPLKKALLELAARSA